MKKIAIGRWIVGFIGIFTAVTPYLADWNETHIYNPRWTPHAKFHNAQTMAFGAVLGILCVYFLLQKKGDRQLQFLIATIFAGLYWVTQSIAALFPGVAFVDPEFIAQNTIIIFGIQTNQVMLDFVIFIILAVAYYLEHSRLKTARKVLVDAV